MQTRSIRFLDFPREIRDAVYAQVFRREHTVRIPKHLSQQTDLLKTTAHENDLSHACNAYNASTSETTDTSLKAPPHFTCEETAPNVKASRSSRLAVLQTSKRVNEEATQQLYAAGSFHFPSDVLMEGDLSVLGHKLNLLRTIELHFDMELFIELEETDELTANIDAIIKANIRFLAAFQEGRRYICTLDFGYYEARDIAKIQWWDALEELDVFERIAVKVLCLELAWLPPVKMYPMGREVSGRSERWDKIKRNIEEDWH